MFETSFLSGTPLQVGEHTARVVVEKWNRALDCKPITLSKCPSSKVILTEHGNLPKDAPQLMCDLAGIDGVKDVIVQPGEVVLFRSGQRKWEDILADAQPVFERFLATT